MNRQNQRFSTTESFPIPQSMAGLVIGKGGKNLKTIHEKVPGCYLRYDKKNRSMVIRAKDFKTAERAKNYLTQIIKTIKKRQQEYEARKAELAKRQSSKTQSSKTQSSKTQTTKNSDKKSKKNNAQHLLRFQASQGSIRGLKSERHSMRRFDDKLQRLYDEHLKQTEKAGTYSLNFGIFRERTLPKLLEAEAKSKKARESSSSPTQMDKSVSDWLKSSSPASPVSTGVWGQKMDAIKAPPQMETKKKGSMTLYSLSKPQQEDTTSTSTPNKTSPTSKGGFLKRREVSELEFLNGSSASDDEFDFVDEDDFEFDFEDEMDLSKDTLDKQHRMRNTIGFDEDTDDWESHWAATDGDMDTSVFA